MIDKNSERFKKAMSDYPHDANNMMVAFAACKMIEYGCTSSHEESTRYNRVLMGRLRTFYGSQYEHEMDQQPLDRVRRNLTFVFFIKYCTDYPQDIDLCLL